MGGTQIIDFCFWGGLYGAAYGFAVQRLLVPAWFSGLLLGVIASLVFWFVVLPLKGEPVAGGWAWQSMIVVLVIQAVWGVGVGLILSLLRACVRWRP